LENWVARAGEVVKPKVQQLPGLEAAYWLVDREGAKGLTITLWESEEAMHASEAFRSQSQVQTSDATGAEVTTERSEWEEGYRDMVLEILKAECDVRVGRPE